MPILKPPMIVLQDTASNGFDLNVRIVDPYDAAFWIAHGSFEQPEPIKNKRWFEYTLDQDYTHGTYSGRIDLACDMLSEAVCQGRLQCVYVVEDGKDHRLEAVDRSILNMKEVECSWEDGFRLYSTDEGDLDDPSPPQFEIDEFYLLWDEVKQLRPGGIDPAISQPNYGAIGVSTAPVLYQAVRSAIEGHTSNSFLKPIAGRSDNRGRPAGKNGAPIAAFVIDLMRSRDMAAIAGEKDDALGARLIEKYVALGLAPPSTRNAGLDARGAVREIMKMRENPDA